MRWDGAPEREPGLGRVAGVLVPPDAPEIDCCALQPPLRGGLELLRAAALELLVAAVAGWPVL